jgi:hypothetical protein
VSRPSFSHLASAGIAGAQKQNPCLPQLLHGSRPFQIELRDYRSTNLPIPKALIKQFPEISAFLTLPRAKINR